ncbi:hypothetical protein [Candidatus Stoquefichus massiliensis]|uniref:hypothetical protein n=1 Tax=Candidatus Stoquefichus massiliensis TaxID=1470350 RepID=UPI0004BCBE54|nr:hypothetical protein [Candidatus Stoquefichus massiliensis]
MEEKICGVIVIGLGMLIVDAIVFYVIYSEQLADKLKCRRIEEMNVIYALVGFVIWNIAGIVLNEKIDLFDMIFSIALSILVFWGIDFKKYVRSYANQ